jgi:putative Mg2+ transporter-C (MgtC) family protein
MNAILEDLATSLPDAHETARVAVRLLAALLAGAVIGLQREHSGAPAGLRTHMLVCMGVALFVIVGTDVGMEHDALSRVIQGIATGVGFLGAGAIMKEKDAHVIHGLTTAAGIWMTAAVGVAIGLGRLGTAALGTIFAWFVLAVVIKAEARIRGYGGGASS